MNTIELKAHAKINLTLDVLGLRPDGFHEVAMVMQGILLHDLVKLTRTKEEKIHLTCNIPELEDPRENLAYKAAALIIRDFPQIGGVKIHLEKRIPVAAGLAGGSTDAAAVLLGLNRIFNLGLPGTTLRAYAAQLGSDVAFCLHPLTALAEGRGEKLTPLPECPLLWLVLFKPPFGVSTKDAYLNLHRVKVGARPSWRKMAEALKHQDRDRIIQEMGNVLEYSTFNLHPELAEFAAEIAGLGTQKLMMSGSGPTLLGFVGNEREASLIAGRWEREGWQVIPTRTLTKRDIKEEWSY